MSVRSLSLGLSGENEAVVLLKGRGYKILARNYRTRAGEIDIVACDKGTVCFVEVKTRHSARLGLPSEAVLKSKQRQISKAALAYLKENNLLDKKARFDVISVMYSQGKPELELIRDAFEPEERFAY